MAVPQEIRDKLAEAIVEFDRHIPDNERSGTELLTGFVVMAAFTRYEDDGETSTQLMTFAGPHDMPMWQELGLLEAGANYIKHTLLTGMDEE